MGRRHAESLELVAAAVDPHVVVPERAPRPDPRGLEPAERVVPVAAEGGRALGVVVVPEREEEARGMVGLPGLDRRTRRALRRAPDSEVADRQDARRRAGRSGEDHGERDRRRCGHSTHPVGCTMPRAHATQPRSASRRVLRALHRGRRQRPRGGAESGDALPRVPELHGHAGGREGDRARGRPDHARPHQAPEHPVRDAVRPRGHLRARDGDRRRRRPHRGGDRPARALRRRVPDPPVHRAGADPHGSGRPSLRRARRAEGASWRAGRAHQAEGARGRRRPRRPRRHRRPLPR